MTTWFPLLILTSHLCIQTPFRPVAWWRRRCGWCVRGRSVLKSVSTRRLSWRSCWLLSQLSSADHRSLTAHQKKSHNSRVTRSVNIKSHQASITYYYLLWFGLSRLLTERLPARPQLRQVVRWCARSPKSLDLCWSGMRLIGNPVVNSKQIPSRVPALLIRLQSLIPFAVFRLQ